MKAIPNWLLIPPLVAALLVLGPLSMQSATTPAWSWPDLWQTTGALLVMALLGLVLLGACGFVPRLRQRGQPPRAAVVTLRQTLRLSARKAVHAIEFDDRILLVAEHEGGLVLLETGRVPAGVGEAPEAAPSVRTGRRLNDFRALLQRVGRA
jgi:flagellar biogenesis protein FliO